MVKKLLLALLIHSAALISFCANEDLAQSAFYDISDLLTGVDIGGGKGGWVVHA